MVFAIHGHEPATGVHVSPFLNPSPASLPSHPSGLSCTGFECPVSCIKPGLVIYITYGNIHVPMLFSQIITLSRSPTESKSLFFISVSFCCLMYTVIIKFSSVQLLSMSDSLQPQESQHARRPCPSPTPWVYSDSRPSSQWCHPAISSSVIPFSSCPQSFPASGSFQMSQLFASGGQSIGVSAQH